MRKFDRDIFALRGVFHGAKYAAVADVSGVRKLVGTYNVKANAFSNTVQWSNVRVYRFYPQSGWENVRVSGRRPTVGRLSLVNA